VPQLDPETWNFTSKKFSAKQIGLWTFSASNPSTLARLS
jgi:hypothetical protein